MNNLGARIDDVEDSIDQVDAKFTTNVSDLHKRIKALEEWKQSAHQRIKTLKRQGKGANDRIESVLRTHHRQLVETEKRIAALEADQCDGVKWWTHVGEMLVRRIEALEETCGEGMDERVSEIDVRVEGLGQAVANITQREGEWHRRIMALENKVGGPLPDVACEPTAGDEPEPCPVCGSAVDVHDEWGKELWFCLCPCSSCLTRGPLRPNQDKAIAAWNAICRDVRRGRDADGKYINKLQTKLERVQAELAAVKAERDELAEIVWKAAKGFDVGPWSREWAETQREKENTNG